jgi:hypothetical protein
MRKILSGLILLILLFSCAEKELDVVARVNEEVLTLQQFQAFFTEQEWEEMNYETKRQYINEWIQLTLLSQEADRSGLSKEAAADEKIKSAIKNVKANLLLAQKIAQIEITEDDLFNYYKLHKSKYQETKTEYKIQRIFLNEKEKLDLVLDLLRQGNAFTETAKEYSEEQLGLSGGYTGFLGKEEIDPAIWEKLLNLKKWQYTSVKINNGYYIFRYYDTQEVTHIKDFIQVEDEIRKIVMEQKKQAIFDEVIDDLKRNADISISI